MCVTEAVWQAELDDYWMFARRVLQLPARTPEGLQAKARVLRSVYNSLSGEDDDVGQHINGLVRDLLGEGST